MLSVFDSIEFEKIGIGGEEWPIYCDFHVLQQIQDAGYGLSEFERLLIGIKDTGEKKSDGTSMLAVVPPDMGAVLLALRLMLMEGMLVYNLLHPAEMKYPDPDQAAAQLLILYRGQPAELAMALHKEFVRCFDDGKKKQSPMMTGTEKPKRKRQTSTS